MRWRGVGHHDPATQIGGHGAAAPETSPGGAPAQAAAAGLAEARFAPQTLLCTLCL